MQITSPLAVTLKNICLNPDRVVDTLAEPDETGTNQIKDELLNWLRDTPSILEGPDCKASVTSTASAQI